jgi:hypothetical protein
MTGILAEAHALTRREGIEFVVVYLPAPFRVYHDATARQRYVTRHQIPRPYATVRGGRPEWRIQHWPDDTHWSPDGHVVAAEAISTFLRGISSKPSRP